MLVRHHTDNDIACVQLPRRMLMADAKASRKFLKGLLKGGRPRLAIDMSAVEHIDFRNMFPKDDGTALSEIGEAEGQRQGRQSRDGRDRTAPEGVAKGLRDSQLPLSPCFGGISFRNRL